MSTGDAVNSGVCLILIDYDNAFPPNADLSDDEIALDVERLLRRFSDRYPNASRFEVRLYGGWYDESNLSRRGSEAARLVTLMPEFPMRVQTGRILRGSIDLAVTPLAADSTRPLLGTYRRRGSLPKVRLTRHPYPEFCAQEDQHCPAAILRSFTKNVRRECPVDACSLVAADAFVVHEQKMVDTMLATDVLTASQMPDVYSAIVVVSGDSDFVPPLLAARAIGHVELLQVRPRGEEASAYATAVLTDAGIQVF
jgi:hypothetical protein